MLEGSAQKKGPTCLTREGHKPNHKSSSKTWEKSFDIAKIDKLKQIFKTSNYFQPDIFRLHN